MEVVTRKRRISAVDLRARVPMIARGLALFLLIAGTIFVGVSYYKMRNNTPFRLRSEAPALSKEVTGIINGYERRITKDNRLHLWLRAARDVTYADGHHELEQVNLQVFPATGDKPNQITSDRSLYDPGNGLLQFNGNVQIETHDAMKVKTDSLTYHQDKEFAETSSAVSFERENVSGKSTGALVDDKNKRLELKNDVEIVVAPARHALVIGQVGAVEAISLLRAERPRRAVAVYFRAPALHHDRRRVFVRVHVDAKFAGTPQDKRDIGRIHLDGLVPSDAAHPRFQRAFRKLHLHDAIVEIEQRQAGAPAQAHCCPADLQFGARIGGHPQPVAGGQRPVGHGPHPIGLAGGGETHRPADLAQTRRARRRLGRDPSVQGERRDAEQNLAAALATVDEFFTQVSESQLLNVPGLQPLRKELLYKARDHYQQFIERNAHNAALAADLAASHYRVALVEQQVGAKTAALESLH